MTKELDQSQTEDVLGKAVLRVWGKLPRDIQEVIFEEAVSGNGELRSPLAVKLHNVHPRTEHER